ncbi:MAG TPA: hypothetical protein VFX98_05070, partial [Longimicrobiaceae bacterium]|nr:hypothetical protein [Longimicrobiaceae bacterium]
MTHAPNETFRLRAYRAVFALAGAYNLAFGAWAGLRPLDFFRVFRMEAPRYPAIWACLGMVVGIYGLLYLYAARHLDRAEPIIAVGLLGKILGPIGLVTTAQGELPAYMLSLLALNDLVWWLPFGLFLLERWRGAARLRALAPWACAALTALALAAMALVLRPGVEVEPEVARRVAYIRGHLAAWRLGWATWMAAAIALTGFYAWWGARARDGRLALLAVLAAGVGLAFDLVGESLYAAWLPGLKNEDFEVM